MARCETEAGGCGAEIEWRFHARTGKRAPVDKYPTPDGNVRLHKDGTYDVITKKERTAATDLFADDDEPRYKLHFASCPNAQRFRRCKRCHRTPCQCPGGPK